MWKKEMRDIYLFRVDKEWESMAKVIDTYGPEVWKDLKEFLDDNLKDYPDRYEFSFRVYTDIVVEYHKRREIRAPRELLTRILTKIKRS